MEFTLTWMSFSWLWHVSLYSIHLHMGTLHCSVIGCWWWKTRGKTRPERTPLSQQDVPASLQTSLAWAMASLPYLVNDFEVNFLKLSLDFYFTHEKPSWMCIYSTPKAMKQWHSYCFLSLSIFPFRGLNGSVLAKYLLFFIPELCAFMKFSWKDT